MIHWLLLHVGVTDASGGWYLWWSGIVGDFALIGAAFAVIRHTNCEVKPCWRLARHQTNAGHKVCRKHHPDGHLTAQHVIDAHEAAK